MFALHFGHFLQGTEETELTLTREGDFVGSEINNVEWIKFFEGQFNRITFEQVMDLNWDKLCIGVDKDKDK